MQVSELDSIAVGIGPGSYTGIRVGAATAKALAYAAMRPLIGICSLYAFVPDSDGPFASIIDAKIGGAYLVCGLKNKAFVQYTCQPTAAPLEKLLPLLETIPTLVTPNAQLLQSKLLHLYPEKQWHWIEKTPDLNHLYHLAQEKYAQKEWCHDPELSLELLYLRKTEAEISRDFSVA